MEKRIEVKKNGAHRPEKQVVQSGNAVVPVDPGSHIKIIVPRDAVAAMQREGDDLVVKFADGSIVRLDGYFNCSPDERSDLVLATPDGGQSLVTLSDATCHPATDSTIEVLTYSLSPIAAAASGGLSTGVLAGLGIAALGGGIAAAAGGGGKGGGATPPSTPADTTPPGAPVVAPSNGKTVTGTAEAGATVRLDTNGDGVADATVTADASGRFSYTPATAIPNGAAVSVTAADAAGNVSPATRIVVDAIAPAPPTIATGTGSGLTGTAEAGSTVSVDVNGDGSTEATVKADANGNWSYTPATPLGDGTRVVVTATDAAGNVSGPASTTLDLAAPAAPTITGARDDVGTIQGAIANGGATDDTLPTLTGRTEAGARIAVFDNGTPIGAATADGTGAWSFTPTAPIAQGSHSFTTVATDAAGNVGAASAPYTILVDTAAPAAPAIGAVGDDVGTMQGNLAAGATTDDARPTLTGTAEAGATVSILDNGVAVGSATAGSDGAWRFTPAAPLAEGSHSLTATATDAAGNVGPVSAATTIIVDTVAPAAAITTVIDDVGRAQGNLGNGAATDDALPTLTGTAEPGATVSIFANDAPMGSVVADSSGAWSFTVGRSLIDLTHRFVVVATDAAGNVGPASDGMTIVVDTVAPAAPVLNPTDGLTISGSAEPGATIAVDTSGDGVTDATATADAAGNWSVRLAAQLANGQPISAIALDAAGNASPPGTATADTSIDTTPPPVPLIGATDDVGAIQGALAGGATTDDAQPALSGAGMEPGAAIAVYDNGTLIGTTIAGVAGDWSVTPAAPLADGAHSFTAIATDASGNVSAASPAFALTVDTIAPGVPTINAGNGAVLSGTAEAGAIVAIDLNGDGTPDATVRADGAGAWTYTPATPLADGTTVIVTASDAAGNASPPASRVIDSVAPLAPVIAAATDDVGALQGNVTSGGQTDDTRPALTGTAEAGATLSILDNGSAIGSVVVDGSGAWAFTPGSPLAEGAHSFVAIAIDASGNAGPASAAYAITIDTTAPAVPVIGDTIDDAGAIQGAIANGGATDDALPLFTGTAEAGATITIVDRGVTLATTVADGTGAWSMTPNSPLADGSYSITTTATDAAGNVSAAAPAIVFTVDTTPPATPIVNPSNGSVLAGTAEAGATIRIDLDADGTPDASVVADGTGAWSYAPSAPLADLSTVTVTAADAAGNLSGQASLVIDATAPAAPTIGGVTDDVGAIQGVIANGGSTDDTLPAIAGTAEAGTTVTIFDNGVAIGSASANGSGAWSFTPAGPLAQGAHGITVTATDATGNVSAASAPFAFSVDTAVPVAPVITNVTDDVGTIQGGLANGDLTDDARPALAGTAEPGTTVTLFDNGAPIGTAAVDGSGGWSFTPAAPLADGGHSFTVIATDAAGNASAPSAAFALTIDTAAVATPAITLVTDDAGALQGTLANGAATDDATPALTGTATPGASVSVFDNGVFLAAVAVDGSGAWGFTPAAPLGDGAHSFTATAIDAAGNSSAVSAPFAIVVDTIAPAVPTINPTNGVTLAGNAEAGTTVSIDLTGDGVADASVIATGAGGWTYMPTTPLPDGTIVAVTAIDPAGNASLPASAIVDAVAPLAPALGAVTDDVGAIQGALVAGGVTDDRQPALTGTAEAGATVSILDNGALIGSTTADGVGAWSFTPVTPLVDGGHSLTLTATDAAGNTGPASAAFAFTVDATAPVAPVLVSVTDDVGTIQGPLSSGASSDDALPLLTGTAEADATVTIFDNGVAIGAVAADGVGAWSFTPTAPLAEGAHGLIAVATDAAGNVGPGSAGFVVTVDTIAPGAPVLNPTDGLTISGTAEPGAAIAIDTNGDGIADAAASANGSGAWTVTLGTQVANGQTISAIASDAAGNASPAGTAIANTGIDTTPPPVPAIAAIDDVGTLQGALASGAATDDTLPALSGTGSEPGATISIYDNGTLIGTTQVDGTGAWGFTPPAPLAEGAHSLTATATDTTGNISQPSAALALTVDTTPPALPTINPGNGAILTGTAEPGATVAIDLDGNGTPDTSVTASGVGGWSYTPGTPLADGTTVIVTAIDAAGNASAPASRVIDAVAPLAPAIVSATDDIGAIQGIVASGGQTDDTLPLLAGTAEAGATLSISDNGVAVGTVTADGAGAWSFTPATPLAQGAHSFTATATDAAGNLSPTSAAYALTVDTSAPVAPAIAGLADDVGTIQGNVASGGRSDDAQPLLSGTAEAGATVSILDNGALIGTAAADGTGAWSFTPAAPLGDGGHSFTVAARDAAGNAGPLSAAYAVTIDTAAPAAPTITAAADDAGAIQGIVANGGVTDDALPVLTGTAEAGATVAILDNGAAIATVTADGSGAWTFTPLAPLAQGTHSFTTVATDAAGNSGPASAAYAVTVDTAAPVAPAIASVTDAVGAIQGGVANGGVTDDAVPVIAGTAEAGATVSVLDNGAVIGTTSADGSGGWTFTPSAPLGQGAHSITAVATDAAGNASAASAATGFTVDTTTPNAPVIVSVTDDVGVRLGLVANGGATDDTIPLLAGTAEAGSTVTVLDNGAVIGSTLVDGAGNWSFAPAVALSEGNHSFSARATDAAGLQSAASTPFTVRVDTSAPAAPAISTVIDDVGTVVGPVAGGGTTNDTIPEIRGTSEAGATLSVFDNGALLGTTQADPAGAWSFTPATALAEGSHSFTASAIDAAGNAGPASAGFAIVIDTTPPATPAITSFADDAAPLTGVIASGGVSNDALPQIGGTAAAGATVRVSDNGVVIGSAIANGAGAWSLTPTAALADGAHSFAAVAIDGAGNASGASAAYGVTIDTVAPAATISITTLSRDTGSVGDWITQDSSPTISGALSAPLGAGERVEIRIDNGAWVNATVTGTSWFYGPGELGTGAHGVGVRVVDTAGNIGNSAAQAITITNVNEAPVVQSGGTALLGLIGADALGLVQIGSQSLTAVDPNNNLRTVQVRYAPLLSVNLGAFTLTASAALAAELGLQLSVVNNPGLLTIVAPSSTLTISAIDGGAISNGAINELLSTVHFQQDLTLLGADVLSATTISATDTNGLNASSGTATLLDVSLLNSAGSGSVLEGGSGNDALNGTNAGERLYGHDGADVLNGNGGNDLLRGGAGADTLDGGAGNDILVYDAADVLINGGSGFDTLLIDKGTGAVLNLDTATNIRNIERIDLGQGDTGRAVTLSEAGVLRATDSNHQLIIGGDSHDSVTMTGATYQGQTLINGQAYDHYALGTATVFVEDPIMVVV